MDLGRALSAHYLLHGSLQKQGAALVLSTTLLDLKSGGAVARANQVLPRAPERLLDALKAVAINLMAGFGGASTARAISPETLGRLRFAQSPKGADISLGLGAGQTLRSIGYMWVSSLQPLLQARLGAQMQLTGGWCAGVQMAYAGVSATGQTDA